MIGMVSPDLTCDAGKPGDFIEGAQTDGWLSFHVKFANSEWLQEDRLAS
jgi:hypothetical protein